MIRNLTVIGISVLAALALVVLLVLVWQGNRKPDNSGQYVALGSSFAAGLGLGPREPGSPFVCMRSTNGYPHHLARLTSLSLVDMSCSGSTTEHIFKGGQVFLGPQLDAVGANTRLVTITSGGNDVGYIGDLTLASGRAGGLGKLFLKAPTSVAERNFGLVTENFVRIVKAIRTRAPKAIIVLVGYPNLLPDSASCDALGFGAAVADRGRQVAARLNEATRLAAEQSRAVFVDMTGPSVGHDVCSNAQWVNGAAPQSGAPFHPNLAGATATAQAVHKAVASLLLTTP